MNSNNDKYFGISPLPRSTSGKTFQYQAYRNPRALSIALFSAVVLSVVMILGAVSRTKFVIEDHFNTLYVCITNLLLFVLLYIYNFWVLRMAIKDVTKFTLSLTGSLLIATLFTALSFNVEALIYGAENTSNLFYINLITNLAAGLISFLISLLMANLMQHQRTLQENEILHSENAIIRHNTLQKQVSPHFLFNSLNTLDGLIGTDDANAHQYLHRLADTFRYTMQDTTEVTLAEELEFTHAYIYMMRIRHGNNLTVVEHIDPQTLSLRMAPISLQLLVENAIKHNVISQRYPLTINIETTPEQTVRVSNELHPKADSEASNGIGLPNLAQRYKMLYQKDISITNDGKVFSVEIPLAGGGKK